MNQSWHDGSVTVVSSPPLSQEVSLPNGEFVVSVNLTDSGQRALYVSVVAVAVGSLAVSQGQAIVTSRSILTPRVVFGFSTTLVIVTVALGRLFGSQQPIREGWTATHVTTAVAWATYSLAGIGLVAVGFRGWVVFANLAVSVGGSVSFWYLYSSDRQP